MEGFSAYYEVCTNLRFNNWTSVWDNVSMVPYAFQDTHWSSYENLQSIRAKAAYAKANRLGGLWFYDISADDFNGTFCGNGTFPLIRSAKSTFENTSIPITTTARPTTTTTMRPYNSTNRMMVCYSPNVAQHRDGMGQFLPENIDAGLCTHLVFSFLGVDENGGIIWDQDGSEDEEGEIDIFMTQRIVNLKRQNPSLKVMVSIGGLFY